MNEGMNERTQQCRRQRHIMPYLRRLVSHGRMLIHGFCSSEASGELSVEALHL